MCHRSQELPFLTLRNAASYRSSNPTTTNVKLSAVSSLVMSANSRGRAFSHSRVCFTVVVLLGLSASILLCQAPPLPKPQEIDGEDALRYVEVTTGPTVYPLCLEREDWFIKNLSYKGIDVTFEYSTQVKSSVNPRTIQQSMYIGRMERVPLVCPRFMGPKEETTVAIRILSATFRTDRSSDGSDLRVSLYKAPTTMRYCISTEVGLRNDSDSAVRVRYFWVNYYDGTVAIGGLNGSSVLKAHSTDPLQCSHSSYPAEDGKVYNNYLTFVSITETEYISSEPSKKVRLP